jgi:hypothetical protein
MCEVAMSRALSNGILEAPPPCLPAHGSYVKQIIRKLPGRTKLPWYWTAPSARSSLGPVYDGLDAGTVFGPVHAVENTLEGGGFISVMVPPPLSVVPSEDCAELPELVWINIFTNRFRYRQVSHHFCTVVSETEVEAWKACGWFDNWVSAGL